MNEALIRCPFCGDTDFDLIGLKMHLARGWCDDFKETPEPDSGEKP